MKNEVRGFLCLMAAIVCFCTHQICDKLFWIAAYIATERPTIGSIRYGGTTLFLLAIAFSIAAILFFIKARQENKSR